MQIYHIAYGKHVRVTCLMDHEQIQYGKPADATMEYPYDPVKTPNPYRGHRGLDTVGDWDQPIMAGIAGTVTVSTYNSSNGNYIWIEKGKMAIGYAHLAKRHVSVGDKVTPTTVIGIEGATGNVTGKHLHTWVRINGKFADPLNYVTKSQTVDLDKYEYNLDHPITYVVDTGELYRLHIRERPTTDADVVGCLNHGDTVEVDKRCDYNGERWGRLSNKPWRWICLYNGENWLVRAPTAEPCHKALDPPQVYISLEPIQGYSAPDWGGEYRDIWPTDYATVMDAMYTSTGGNVFCKQRGQEHWYIIKNSSGHEHARGGWAITDTYTLLVPTKVTGYDLAMSQRGDTGARVIAPDGTKLA